MSEPGPVFQPARARQSFGGGSFRAARSWPGLGVPGAGGDPGFGPLGCVDRARLGPGAFIAMHEHRDDEIVSILRSGALVHTDSTGRSQEVRPDRLMVMGAGRGFSHEERVAGGGEPVEMLQVFLRPEAAGLDPRVGFRDLAPGPAGGWRFLTGPRGPSAGPPDGASVRSGAWIFDVEVGPGGPVPAPPAAEGPLASWLLAFSGGCVGAGVRLDDGDSLAVPGGGLPSLVAGPSGCVLVLFLLDLSSAFTRAGGMSGG